MVKRKDRILLKPENLKPSSNRFEIIGVLNPGAARLKNGKIILYVRVIEKLKKFHDDKYYYSPRFVGKDKFKIKLDKFKKSSVVGAGDLDFHFKDETKRLAFISHLRRIYLDKTGANILKVEQRPGFFGTNEDAELGVEDPRITKIGNKYYMTYVGLSRSENISTYLAESDDCINWKRKGIIFGEQDKDVVLFPEKVMGKYIAYDRPEGNFEFSVPHVWIAFSKDLIHWGELDGMSLSKRKKEFSRSGAGPPPIKTDKGWLLIFHGVSKISKHNFVDDFKKFFGVKVKDEHDTYAVWAALFDLKNPKKLIARSNHPIMIPNTKYKSFEGKNVIFPTGIVEDGNNLLLYSGVGDTKIMVSKIKLKDIMKCLS